MCLEAWNQHWQINILGQKKLWSRVSTCNNTQPTRSCNADIQQSLSNKDLLIEIVKPSYQCKTISKIFIEEWSIFKTNDRACYEVYLGVVLNWYKELTWLNTTQRNTCFLQTNFFDWLNCYCPQSSKKRPVIAFVHNNSNVYRKEKNK